jgi:hypothetical protein
MATGTAKVAAKAADAAGTTVNQWRYWKQPVSGSQVPVFVQRISSRGTAYVVKPNPWALKSGDARAGWTQRQSVRAEHLVPDLKVPPFIQAAISAAIGEPQHALETVKSEGGAA